MARVWLRISRGIEMTILVAVGILLLSFSGPRPEDEQDRARSYTRNIEFEYLSWMLDAARIKAQTAAAGIPGYLDRASSRIAVSDYLQTTQEIMRAEGAMNRIYADPTILDKETAAAGIRENLARLRQQQDALAPLAEGVLQSQVAQVAAGFNLATLGQTLPAVLFHTTAVPDALIVSPRDEIRQSANISIEAGLTVDQQAALELEVERGLDASALVVPIGGVGVYPTMIMQTTDRRWLVSTVAHEWTHNYLELRPLGWLYDHTPELRTMNETTADIVGNEIGDEVIRQFYSGVGLTRRPRPQLIGLEGGLPNPDDPQIPAFDFRAEMHTTRITVDRLLASGRIVEAEHYMEQRRRMFVDNGYFIRRLNQAYFAFYGAYADTPGGAAGQDPVGPAVRALRAKSSSLADFLNRMAWMTSFEELQKEVGH